LNHPSVIVDIVVVWEAPWEKLTCRGFVPRKKRYNAATMNTVVVVIRAHFAILWTRGVGWRGGR